jgi:hypothetical protein
MIQTTLALAMSLLSEKRSRSTCQGLPYVHSKNNFKSHLYMMFTKVMLCYPGESSTIVGHLAFTLELDGHMLYIYAKPSHVNWHQHTRI